MELNHIDKPWKILVIDDSKLNRAIIKKNLSDLNMVITESVDGVDGIDKLKKGAYDLILVDIVMPNMDGYEFITRFREFTRGQFTPAILMTGTDDLNSKIKGLRIGADDFLLKPLNEKELVARVLSLLRLKYTHDELYRKNQQIKKEMIIARKVQEYIIPKDFSHIKYPVISARYLPIDDLGGDYFDCFVLPGNKTGFLIADVVGHGIPAALIMAMSKMIFHIYSTQFDNTSEILTLINSQLKGLILDNQYITSFYVIYDDVEKKIHFTNAGHTKALLYRKLKNSVLALDTSGFFLGIADDPKYEQKTLEINPGDRLLLYTDGLTEIKNSEDLEFGEKNLARSIQKNAGIQGDLFCDGILGDISQFSSLEKRSDDIAFLSIEF